MNCPQCKAVVPAGAGVCPNCQSVLPFTAGEAARPGAANDGPSIGLGILGFFIPLIGAILWLSMKGSTPRKARSAGVGALVGFVGGCAVVACLVFTARNFVAKGGTAGAPVKTLAGQGLSTPAATFGQTAFTKLAHGAPEAESYLDWQALRTADADVSAIYKFMPGEDAKAGFRKSFVKSFARSFTEKGATAESLSHWHTESQSQTATTVSATAPNGRALVLNLSKRDGFWRISKIDFR